MKLLVSTVLIYCELIRLSFDVRCAWILCVVIPTLDVARRAQQPSYMGINEDDGIPSINFEEGPYMITRIKCNTNSFFFPTCKVSHIRPMLLSSLQADLLQLVAELRRMQSYPKVGEESSAPLSLTA